MAHAVIQEQDGRDGAGQGQHDVEKEFGVAAAVQLGGLHQFAGNVGGKECAAHDHVVHAQGSGQNQRPHGVEQTGIPHHQVGGHHAAAHEHGNDVKQGDGLVQGKILAAQGVGGGQGHRQVDGYAHGGVQQGVEEAAHDGFGFEYFVVSVQGEAHGIEHHFAARYRYGIGERGNDDEVQRIGYQQKDDGEDNENDGVIYHVTAGAF